MWNAENHRSTLWDPLLTKYHLFLKYLKYVLIFKYAVFKISSQVSTCAVCYAQLCPTLCDPMDAGSPSQPPLSMGFFRQECWSGLPFLLPGDLPEPGIELVSPECWQILHHWATRESHLQLLEQWSDLHFSEDSPEIPLETVIIQGSSVFDAIWP